MGTSTKNAGSPVRVTTIIAPAATRSATLLPRQAMTVATRPTTPRMLPMTRIPSGGPVSPSGPA